MQSNLRTPESGVPEIAFAGRSKCRYQVAINLLTRRKFEARVAVAFMHLFRTINFYRINA